MDKKTVTQGDPFVTALTKYLDEKIDRRVREALGSAFSDDRIDHARWGRPLRVCCASAAAGEIEGAIKVGRRWLATRSAVEAWLARSAEVKADVIDITAAIDRASKRAAGGSR